MELVVCDHWRLFTLSHDAFGREKTDFLSDTATELNLTDTAARRQYLADTREIAGQRLAKGVFPNHICERFSARLDDLLVEILKHSLARHGVVADAEFLIACVGGNGRRRPAPWSDVDLLLVVDDSVNSQVSAALDAFVRDCWDAGMELGHSIRTPADVIRFAAADIQFATSLIDMRLLFGDQRMYHTLHDKLDRRIFRGRGEQFIARCVASRRDEWLARGDSVNQLEPDLKKSPGGLRDLHLLRWIAYARYGDAEPATLL